MKTRAFLWLSIVAVAATGMLHGYSYVGEVSRGVLVASVACCVVLFASVVIASFLAVRGGKLPDAWNEHWRAAIVTAPKWVRYLFIIAWLGGVIALGRTMITHVSHVVEFHTAWCFGVATMALCFALGSRRSGAQNA